MGYDFDIISQAYFMQYSTASHPWALRCRLVTYDGELRIESIILHDSRCEPCASIGFKTVELSAMGLAKVVRMHIESIAAYHPRRDAPLWCNDTDMRMLRADVERWLLESTGAKQWLTKD